MSVTENCVSLYCSNPIHQRKRNKPRHYLANIFFNIPPATFAYVEKPTWPAKSKEATVEKIDLFPKGIDIAVVPYASPASQFPIDNEIVKESFLKLPPLTKSFITALVKPQKETNVHLIGTVLRAKTPNIDQVYLTESVIFLERLLNPRRGRRSPSLSSISRLTEKIERCTAWGVQKATDKTRGGKYLTVSPTTLAPILNNEQATFTGDILQTVGFNSPVIYRPFVGMGGIYALELQTRELVFTCTCRQLATTLPVESVIKAALAVREAGITELNIATLEKYCA